MKVIVASASLWPTPGLASMVLSIMLSTDEDFEVRGPSGSGYTSSIEEMTAKIGQRIGRLVTTIPPEQGGRAGVYRRDNAMVNRASHVYAFFAPGEMMQGGTGHVVASALRKGKPVDAYELDPKGNVVEVGSDPGDLVHLWEDGGYEWTW